MGTGIPKKDLLLLLNQLQNKKKLIKMLQSSHNIPQAIANDIISSFNMKKFRNTVINWIAKSN